MAERKAKSRNVVTAKTVPPFFYISATSETMEFSIKLSCNISENQLGWEIARAVYMVCYALKESNHTAFKIQVNAYHELAKPMAFFSKPIDVSGDLLATILEQIAEYVYPIADELREKINHALSA